MSKKRSLLQSLFEVLSRKWVDPIQLRGGWGATEQGVPMQCSINKQQDIVFLGLYQQPWMHLRAINVAYNELFTIFECSFQTIAFNSYIAIAPLV